MMQRKGGAGLRAWGIASALAALAVLSFSMVANAQSDSMSQSQPKSQVSVFIRVVTSHGEIAGDATDPAHQGWIACREASMPSVSEITATNQSLDASQSHDVAAGQASGKRMHGPGAPVKEAGSAQSSAVAAQPGDPAPRDTATGQASGKRRWEPVTIMKVTDKATPILYRLAASGESIPEVDIALYRDEGGKMVPSGTYKLTNAMISSVQKMSSGEERPMESITFTYQKIEMTH
jgi:type VI protein secretion system component Hcp